MKPDFNYVECYIVDYILNEKPEYFIHGVNTTSLNGGGIAGVLYNTWYKSQTSGQEISDELVKALGKAPLKDKSKPILLCSGIQTVLTSSTSCINLYTQLTPGPYANEHAIYIALLRWLSDLKNHDLRNKINPKIAMPRIGCGIGCKKEVSQKDFWQNSIKPILKDLFEQFSISFSNITIIGLPGDNEKYGD